MRINFNLLKTLCLVGFWGTTNSYTQAQTIPDRNFAAAIRSICPTCIDASNTLLTPAKTLTYLSVTNKKITDLTGITGFVSLQTFYCDSNSLAALPILPNGLMYLICRNNQLSALPNLPNNLIYLDCSDNQLSSLPVLPNVLRTLYCDMNQLTSLPTLPNSLDGLVCGKNKLTSLPNLPSSLTDLVCRANQLISLPTLPSSLSSLLCDNNKLTVLPNLPNTLTNLWCFNNQLTLLPDLPNKLTALLCYFNQIKSLPNLPNTLTILYCSNNQLTILPKLNIGLTILECFNNPLNALYDLPYTLTSLNCSNNQLTFLPALPDVLKVLSCSDNPLNMLPNLPSTLTNLNCKNNNLNRLPNLPNTLITLDCSNNPLKVVLTLPNKLIFLNCTNDQLTTLPILPNTLKTLYSGINQIKCLPALPNSLELLRIDRDRITCFPNTVKGLVVSDVDKVEFSTPPVCTAPTATLSGTQTINSAVQTVNLSVTLTGVGSWELVLNGKTYTATASPFTIALSPTATTTYTLTSVKTNCNAGTVSGQAVVTVNQCSASISGTNFFCKGTSTTLTANAQSTTGAVQYQWKQDGTNVGDGKSTWAVSQAGSYVVEITDANGCKAISAALSMVGKGLDIVAAVKPEGSLNIYVPDSVALSATTSDPRLRYQWRKDDKDLAGATKPVYAAKSSGSYAITVSDADCAITSSAVQVTVLIPLAVEANVGDDLRIYPNPTDGLLVASAQSQKNTAFTLRLLNMEGRILQTFELPSQPNFEKSINISHYSSGYYILEMSGKEFVKRVRIVKK